MSSIGTGTHFESAEILEWALFHKRRCSPSAVWADVIVIVVSRECVVDMVWGVVKVCALAIVWGGAMEWGVAMEFTVGCNWDVVNDCFGANNNWDVVNDCIWGSDTIDRVAFKSVVRTQVNKGIYFVVSVRFRRSWVRERNVVTTVVIALVALLLLAWYKVLLTRILRLANMGIVRRERKRSIVRFREGHFLFFFFPWRSTIRSNIEEFLDLWADNWPWWVHARLLPVAEVMTFEANLLFFFLIFSEIRVNVEYRRPKFLVVRVNGLDESFIEFERLNFDRLCQPCLSLSSLSITLRL